MSDEPQIDEDQPHLHTLELAAVHKDPIEALKEGGKVILDSRKYNLSVRLQIDSTVIVKFEELADLYGSTTDVELEKFYAYLISCTYDLMDIFGETGFTVERDHPLRIHLFFGGSTTGELDKKLLHRRKITDIVLMRAEVENLKPFPLMFKLARSLYMSNQIKLAEDKAEEKDERPPAIHFSNYVLDIIALLACKAKFFEFELRDIPRYKLTPRTWDRLKSELLGNPTRTESGEDYTNPLLNYVFSHLDKLPYNEFMGFFRNIVNKDPEYLFKLFISKKSSDNRRPKTEES